MKTLQIVIAGVFCIIYMSADTIGQTWKDIDPLKTTRDEVFAIQEAGRQEADGNVINTGKERIEIKYYSGGCDSYVVNELKLSKDIVVQVKVEFESDLIPPALVVRADPDVEKVDLDERNSARVDHRSGFVEITRIRTNMPATAETLYYVPETILLPQCLLNQLDPIVGTIFGNSAKWRNGKQTDFYTTTYLEKPGLSRMNIADLRLFAETLKNNKRSTGYIYFYSDESQKDIGSEFWMNEIYDYLNRKLNISDDKFTLLNAGNNMKALVVLIVVTERLEDADTISK